MAPAVTGATVTRVTVLDERSLRRHDGPAEDFTDRLEGRTLTAPLRRGKFLWVPLAPDAVHAEPVEALVIHLGMSGQVLVREAGVDDRHTRIRLDLAAG